MRISALVFLAIGALPGVSPAQDPVGNSAVSSETHFTGTVNTRVAGKPRKMRIEYRTWSIGPGTRLDGLPIKTGGEVLYELHSGKLVTRTAGEEVERVPGTFWTVKSGEHQALETFDDTVVLRTIVRR